MYITKLHCNNVGPVRNVTIEPIIKENGNPNPVVVVGENGSGKSTILSNIVDSLYEIAALAFDDAVMSAERGVGHQYFKRISGDEIYYGESKMYSAIEFQDSSISGKINYLFKCGDLSIEEFKKNDGDITGYQEAWFTEKSGKYVGIDKKQATQLFQKNVLCYFGPDRYEKPQWMGDKYFDDISSSALHPSIASRVIGQIPNPIQMGIMTDANLQWLLDVIVDSRSDVIFEGDGIKLNHVKNVNDLRLLGIARKNAEQIMSAILGVESCFGLNNRAANSARFCVYEEKTGRLLLRNLGALSTGQSALFNMFVSIVRYADTNNINQSIKLEDIAGVVVIDEIELHLHSKLQREVLPRLLKLFPKIQFIITTHSPLFLLGVEKEYGPESIDIYQMPTGTPISAESFSEFQNAYEYMIQTEQHRKEIESIINLHKGKPLIITEGATDWRHLKTAWNKLSTIEGDPHNYKGMDFDFLEYEPGTGSKDGVTRLEMGGDTLATMCESMSKLNQDRLLIFIADRDKKEVNKRLKTEDTLFKSWGNRVYSILIPVPMHRNETPEICIEHYYKDSEIKTPMIIDGVERRMYLGNEFDRYGRSERYFCTDRNSCGPNKINIIDGQEDKRVFANNDNNNTNVALPKMAFANAVMRQEQEDFKGFDFSAFVDLFDIVKQIIEA